MTDITLLGLSGSLRRDSFNSALLRAAGELLPPGVSLVVHDYRDIPLFDADVEEPAAVLALKSAIASADGMLIATPEYNFSVPGVLKNAIDWASRPANTSPLAGKPTAVVSASLGVVGGARAQQHLKNVLLGVSAPVFPHPELLVGGAAAKFVDGRLADEATRKFLAGYLTKLADWVRKTR